MTGRRLIGMASALALLAGCGGGGGGSGGSSGQPTAGVPSPSPSPTATAGCSLRERQDWAAAQLREWYLFPETLPATLNPASFTTVDDYIDALTATARGQRRDRFFTFLTSIAEENAFNNQGASGGAGFRLAYDSAARRLFVSEAFEGGPALEAGIDRGAEIVAVGASAATLRTVSDIVAQGGTQALSQALGPDTAGDTRFFRIASAGSGGGQAREVSVTKRDFTLQPVSPRYGSRIIDDGGRRVGYVNLRTFINTADPQLRQAFATFRAQNVTEVIVDFRYNGGGLLSIADLMGDLLGRDRATTDVFNTLAFRPEKASENRTRFFQPKPESIAPMRVAFIGTGQSASASELVINSFVPYLGNRGALVGTNTFGKPVGQIALDRAQCDDRLRVVAFASQNRDGRGDYYSGLATTVPVTCRATDDLAFQLGDPNEASMRAALDFLAGRSCSPITATASADARSLGGREFASERDALVAERPSAAQRQVPGLF